MPNRVIKESIKRSPEIDSLTWFEEVVFYRMIVSADDYGCLDGRTILLKNELFPTKENVTKKSIEDAVSKLASVGLVRRYAVNDMPYLFLPTWERHQRIRNKHRKYPEPAFDSNSRSNAGQMTDNCRSESESNPNQNPNQNPNDSAEQQAASAPPVIRLPLNDGTEYEVSVEQCHEWAGLYPAVDVMQQLREMRGWLIGNPRRRKTKSGVLAFVTRWLSKEQNKGGKRAGKEWNTANPFLEMLEEEQE